MSKQKSVIYIKAPIAYYGGKQQLLPAILPLIPNHKKYVEPFLGGGAVYWGKPLSEYEVINDLDGFVVNFYQVLKSDFVALRTLVEATVYGRQSHEQATVIRQSQAYFTPVQRAWAFYVLANGSMYASLDCPMKVSMNDPQIVRTFYSKVRAFGPHLADRLSNTFVEQRDAIYVLEKHDGEGTFFFVDPPYFNSDMGHYTGYTDNDFERLLSALLALKGKFILTCYPSDLLDRYAELANGNWLVERREMQLSAGAKGKRKVEVLVRNYA